MIRKFNASADEEIEKPTLLVVEDDSDMQRLIELELMDEYQVVTAGNGRVGLEKALESIPDLVITDLMMPVMDGVELCRELKSNTHTSHIPVIMLTAKDSVESQIQGLETGADDYVTKPFHMGLLKVRIHNLLESRRVLRERLGVEFSSMSEQALPESVMERDFLAQALRVVEEHMGEPTFNPDHFAEEMHMSVSTLHRKMKAITNHTPMKMINEVRLKTAARLLAESSLNITEIAYEVGVDGSTQFGRLFKAQYGVTPSQYRADSSAP
ncbi:response regulator transcription factor [Pontiella sulfatireligans]|uniref:Response regulator ArlR n=1 Tax=Pontiella sulfatireligans TaxID=2750658 RepID=A0A6C2UVV8_9BACT|nr:response regulator [Pontiella sulfatireligans]VGO23541.1 Response regulator ArlR [Pontiella sulfatireligans]